MTISSEQFESIKTNVGRATLQIIGDSYVMEGPSGHHSISVSNTDIARLKKHWKSFTNDPANMLPTRRNAGLTLSLDEGSNTLEVKSLGYSASLTCAANEGCLSNGTEDRVLTHAQIEVVLEWMEFHDDYLRDLGGSLNLDYDDKGNWVGPVANENGWTP